MLPKKNRADKKAVEEIFKKGKFIDSLNLTFKFLITPEKERKISFIAPKSIAKKAVERNYLRRLGYSALEKILNNFPAGIMGVFIFKRYENNILIIENEVKNILNKIN
ncbi:MAG: Ribonuclease P protein component [Candidatus Nomurabacteria bacterium GW2011_GWA1_37_20]|uniref:Ribonuclease P protein component n=2 Tax=Parcubacteria group TaxID=1794811 RepID=A0A0G0L512_9BACT|nr:MAG: Ribonuclease P protein component [Parcubacteria group bacterium GW2011_GWC1_36_9]KKQ28540.1 MAG: Ribonuclease P protein component [Parcubacteria group bacterium GW2011_GWB1_37_13]KKQ33851.1 MAG: Ribonuclease P protein component [Candidatus Nomurabacteria bacterium GW2011_GWA1_37_20]KKQ47731.1 MAG: Ribonuclease P protein component [Candidatus Yanofskybacteria bacterium GW2011_GWC2_37_9]